MAQLETSTSSFRAFRERVEASRGPPTLHGFVCFVAFGVLVASCSETPPSDPLAACFPARDTTLELDRDSVGLTVGGAVGTSIQGSTPSCFGSIIPEAEVQRTVADPSIATWAINSGVNAQILGVPIEALSPGRTVAFARWGTVGDSVVIVVADTVPMGQVLSVAAGGSASCAVDADGVARCWGYGAGVLGDPTGPAIGTCFGVFCSTVPVPRNTGTRSVYLSERRACSLDPAGAARCWGSGPLGTGSNASSHEPVEVSGGLVFASLSLGVNHTCGVAADGGGYCWGFYDHGRLGVGEPMDSVLVPTAVAGSPRLKSIAVRDETTCAVTEAGQVLCWGVVGPATYTASGTHPCVVQRVAEKGGSSSVARSCSWSPIPMSVSEAVAGDTTFAQVNGNCALTTQGRVYCQDVSVGASFVPKAASAPFVTVAAGRAHMCGLDATGAAWCAGANQGGQLGDGTSSDRSATAPVAGGHSFVQLAAGDNHTCGVDQAGVAWCWGTNAFGQVGVPILADTKIPRRVRGQR